MASVRLLKKELDFMFSSVLNDCFYVAATEKSATADKIDKIAAGILEKHAELRKRVNHPDGKDNGKMVKGYYQTILKELYQSVDEALNELLKIKENN